MKPKKISPKQRDTMAALVVLHVGKKCPKGWTEKSAMHLGNGVWALRCQKETKAFIDTTPPPAAG